MLQLLRNVAGLGAAVAALGATLPTAEAQPTASRPPSCFYTNQILNTRMANPRTLYIRTSARRYYRMDFASDCDTDVAGPLVIHPFGDNAQICSAISVDVSLRETGQRCMPTQLTALTPDEVAQVPKKDLP
ncbi:MAG TPA: hypothetical protein VN814_11930 [Caulobacteraceae bacterium]|nr:hypothetical protein [Caulobacteraceae bacterium]